MTNEGFCHVKNRANGQQDGSGWHQPVLTWPMAKL